MGLFSRSKKSKEEVEFEKEQNQLEHKIEPLWQFPGRQDVRN